MRSFMKNKDIKCLQEHLAEAGELSKRVYYYLYEVQKERPLTAEEKKIDEMAHAVHVHVNHEYVFLEDEKEEKNMLRKIKKMVSGCSPSDFVACQRAIYDIKDMLKN